jgi:hypothetical protein
MFAPFWFLLRESRTNSAVCRGWHHDASTLDSNHPGTTTRIGGAMSTIAADTRAKTAESSKSDLTRKLLEWGGFAAGAVLIAFGVVAIVMGFGGRATVSDSLKQEKIVGTADMTPSAIKAEATKAGLDVNAIDMPTVSVAGKQIDNGDRARAFASYMRVHTLEATGGYTYSQMGRFQAKPDTPKAQLAVGGGTDNPQWAAMDTATKQPVANGARNIWVTETALTTALNSSYMAEKLGLFGIVVGVALLLSGIGFVILAFSTLHRRLVRAS